MKFSHLGRGIINFEKILLVTDWPVLIKSWVGFNFFMINGTFPSDLVVVINRLVPVSVKDAIEL